jgi:hypothetical protein
MALTKRTDLIYVDILQEAIKAAFAGKKALFGTGAAILNTSLPTLGNDGMPLKGGDTVRIPYFDTIGEFEDVAEGGALTPAGLTMTSETATIIHSGKAGEITNWAQLTAQFSDPYAEYARQFVEGWMRRIDLGLLTVAGTSTLISDISSLVGNAAMVSYTALNNAKLKWGDESEDIRLLVVHSNVMNDLENLMDSGGHPLLVPAIADGQLPRFRGIPTKVSDRVRTTGTGASAVYNNLLCKEGAMAAWVNGMPTILQEPDILADTVVTATHTYHVEHLYKRPKGGTGTKPGVVLFKTKSHTALAA